MGDTLDLHIHTNHSDGTLSVAEILEMAREKSLIAIALADHDTIGGYRAIRQLLTDGDPEVIAGVELSAAVDDDDLHILAYLFDPDDTALNEALTDFQQKRNRRGRMIVERLKDCGIEIPFEAVVETADGGVIGRPHVAETLHRLGATRSYQESFDLYIAKGRPAYVPKAKFTPPEVIDLIHNAGGVAVLAHPLVDGMIKHLNMLVELGLDGMEVWHYSVLPKDINRLKRLAEEHKLLISGGSDFHGRGEWGQTLGIAGVETSHLDDLKKRSLEIRGQA